MTRLEDVKLFNSCHACSSNLRVLAVSGMKKDLAEARVLLWFWTLVIRKPNV
jgi:hypothetical protein